MSALDPDVAAMRHFTRFYTRQIGALEERLLDSPFSLTESRVLYELANRSKPTATELARDLGLDPGYLSRILRSFASRGLIARTPSQTDGRQNEIALTNGGRAAFVPLDRRSRDLVAGMLQKVGEPERQRLVRGMRAIEALLGGKRENRAYVLRPPRPGDMGWVVSRHGALYSEEYGWNVALEALVSEVVAEFVRNFDAARERCWIADIDGEPVGSIFLVRHSDQIAKLRLLLVEPHARGMGIGAALIDACVGFARDAGYRSVVLWTNDSLVDARRLYERAGFELVNEGAHHSFGRDLVEQTWRLELGR